MFSSERGVYIVCQKNRIGRYTPNFPVSTTIFFLNFGPLLLGGELCCMEVAGTGFTSEYVLRRLTGGVGHV
jgi:hypothetical protein